MNLNIEGESAFVQEILNTKRYRFGTLGYNYLEGTDSSQNFYGLISYMGSPKPF